MAGEIVQFATVDGQASGYLATPESPNGRALIVVQEWWGLMDEIKAIADRYAAAGYYALVPDLYRGETTDQPDEAQQKLMALNVDQAEKDLVGAVDFVAERAGASKVGSTGTAWAAHSASTRRPRIPRSRQARASTTSSRTESPTGARSTGRC